MWLIFDAWKNMQLLTLLQSVLLCLSFDNIYVISNRFQRSLRCESSSFFRDTCDWSFDAISSINESLLICNKSHSIFQNYSSVLHGRNFYLIGNSVTRHYSFNIKYALDKYNGFAVNKQLSREEEKQKCGYLLDVNSCTHYLSGDNLTKVEFMWRLIIDSDNSYDKRNICYGRNDTIDSCLQDKFRNTSAKDILITSTSIDNEDVSHARRILDMYSNVFSGAIIWLSLPYWREPSLNVTLSRESTIVRKNAFIREAINSYCSERIIFLNTFPLLKNNSHLYADPIHHPGKLSDMVVQAIFSTLKPWNTNTQ